MAKTIIIIIIILFLNIEILIIYHNYSTKLGTSF